MIQYQDESETIGLEIHVACRPMGPAHDMCHWEPLTGVDYFEVSGSGFGESSVQLERMKASSPFYDGEWTYHSRKGNSQESVSIRVLGQNQLELGKKVRKLIEWFTQPKFLFRVTLGHEERTWQCFAADYQINRSHVMIHNTIAEVTFSFERLPSEQVSVRL